MYTRFEKIRGFIVVFFEPVSIASLGCLLPLEKSILDDAMVQLRSAVDMLQDEGSSLGLVHLSFRDFLLHEERSKQLEFHVEEILVHQSLFGRCLELISDPLRQDICELHLAGKFSSEVLRSQVGHYIPGHLK